MLNKRAKFKLTLWIICALLGVAIIYTFVPQIFGDTVYPMKYDNFIRTYSEKYDVDPALVAAVIFQESRFNPNAVSPVGAQGLMQFMPGTAATMAKETGRWPNYNIFDPETSVEFGAAHLRDLLVKYNGNLDAALAGYNAGTGNADKWVRQGILDRIPFRETNNYVKKVKQYQTVYATMYPNELGITPPVAFEKTDSKSKIAGFIWSQLFANVFNISK